MGGYVSDSAQETMDGVLAMRRREHVGSGGKRAVSFQATRALQSDATEFRTVNYTYNIRLRGSSLGVISSGTPRERPRAHIMEGGGCRCASHSPVNTFDLSRSTALTDS